MIQRFDASSQPDYASAYNLPRERVTLTFFASLIAFTIIGATILMGGITLWMIPISSNMGWVAAFTLVACGIVLFIFLFGIRSAFHDITRLREEFESNQRMARRIAWGYMETDRTVRLPQLPAGAEDANNADLSAWTAHYIEFRDQVKVRGHSRNTYCVHTDEQGRRHEAYQYRDGSRITVTEYNRFVAMLNPEGRRQGVTGVVSLSENVDS